MVEADPKINLRDVYPNRLTKTFSNGVTITSDFDSGTLLAVSEANSQPNATVTAQVPVEQPQQPEANEDNSDGEAEKEGNTEDFSWDSMFTKTDDLCYCYDIWISPDGAPFI